MSITTPTVIPTDVLEQFDANAGAPGEWLPHRYSPGVIRFWWAKWLEISPKGREVATELEDLAAAELFAHRERAEYDRKQQEKDDAARREQERYRLPAGSEVRVSHPQTHIDGQTGRVLKTYWRGRELVTDVVIDPLPPGHPEEGRPIRLRRSGLMPFSITVAAATLNAQSPAATGSQSPRNV
jgi:hypothetical protein